MAPTPSHLMSFISLFVFNQVFFTLVDGRMTKLACSQTNTFIHWKSTENSLKHIWLVVGSHHSDELISNSLREEGDHPVVTTQANPPEVLATLLSLSSVSDYGVTMPTELASLLVYVYSLWSAVVQPCPDYRPLSAGSLNAKQVGLHTHTHNTHQTTCTKHTLYICNIGCMI